MIINKEDKIKWEENARINRKYFRRKTDPIETSTGVSGISTSVVVGDGVGGTKTLTFVEGILTSVV